MFSPDHTEQWSPVEKNPDWRPAKAELCLIREERRRFLPLLLLADPCEAMVERYLDRGALWLLREEDGGWLAEAVVTDEGGGLCEVKNLAVPEALHGRGYGSVMLELLFQHYVSQFHTMQVGTSESGVPFYMRLGFRPSHLLPGFFTDHYPEPIWENGIQCVDMYCLRRPL